MAKGMKTINQYREDKKVENPSFKGLECKQVIDDLANAYGRLHSLVSDLQGYSETLNISKNVIIVVSFAMLDIQDALQHFDIDIKEYYYYQKNTLKK